MTRLVGVDPGVTGAVALIEDGLLADLVDMPVVDRTVDCYHLTGILADWGAVDRVTIETPTPRPGQAVRAVYRSGENFGRIVGVLAALARPVALVTPAVWTRQLSVGADKDTHRRRAMDEWPGRAEMFRRVRDDGRADAALIALWAHHQQRPSALHVQKGNS